MFATLSGVQQGRRAIKQSEEALKLMMAETLDMALTSATGEAARKAVADKTFVHRQGWWIDTTFNPTEHKDAKRIEVESFSDAYFKLLRKHPRLARYASAGERCVVVFEGTAYVIKPAAPEAVEEGTDNDSTPDEGSDD